MRWWFPITTRAWSPTRSPIACSTECHRRGVPVLVKPKTSRLFAYRGATAIVCNAKEAGFFVTRALDDDESVEQAGRALLAHFGCAAVVITRGRKGMSLFEERRRNFHVPATSFEVSYARVGQPGVDAPRTAGRFRRDRRGRYGAFRAGAGRRRRRSDARAAVLANAGAGVVVGKLGTSTVTPAELLAAVRDLSSIGCSCQLQICQHSELETTG